MAGAEGLTHGVRGSILDEAPVTHPEPSGFCGLLRAWGLAMIGPGCAKGHQYQVGKSMGRAFRIRCEKEDPVQHTELNGGMTGIQYLFCNSSDTFDTLAST